MDTREQARGWTVTMPSYFAISEAKQRISSRVEYMSGSYMKPKEPPKAPPSMASSTSRNSRRISALSSGLGSSPATLTRVVPWPMSGARFT
jgi:hypothetical protein